MSISPTPSDGFPPCDPDVAEYLLDRQYLDGPKLVKWMKSLDERLDTPYDGGVSRILGETAARRIYEWERGTDPHYSTVDRMLVKRFGMVLDVDVPEWVWKVGQRKRRVRKGRTVPTEVKREAVAAARAGEPRDEIAGRLDVSPRSIVNWVQKADEELLEGIEDES